MLPALTVVGRRRSAQAEHCTSLYSSHPPSFLLRMYVSVLAKCTDCGADEWRLPSSSRCCSTSWTSELRYVDVTSEFSCATERVDE